MSLWVRGMVLFGVGRSPSAAHMFEHLAARCHVGLGTCKTLEYWPVWLTSCYNGRPGGS